ncbi:coatomer subunit beta [Nematocida major]|uniref:coatomer subunit beta n=1 Tax=Nematocida major TaxID=1912982 RepID=UPI002008E38B|nr:coatomer subunit beta [Nematocida major]KAH9385726.1 coatomer subunit beta [Nematocida major]
MSTTCGRALYASRDLDGVRSKDSLKMLLTRGTDENKIDALWQIIKETGMGVNHESLLMTLTMVIPNSKDKKLIQMFYLYMENIAIEDAEGNIRDEVLMLCNMIRGHLAHPNEYVRARAIRAVGKFRSASIFDVLKVPFVENISYSNPFVRSAIYIALRSLLKSRELSSVFSDVIPALREQLLKEGDPVCLSEGYKTVEEVDKACALEIYEKMKDTAHECLQECFIRSAEAAGDAQRVLEIFKGTSSRRVELQAGVALVRISADREVLKPVVEKLFDMSSEYLDAHSKEMIINACKRAWRSGRFSFENMAIQIAQMITPALAKVNESLSQSILEMAMGVLSVVEARELFVFLCQNMQSPPVNSQSSAGHSGSKDKIFFMRAQKELLKKYRMHTEEQVQKTVELLCSGVPELAMEAAEFLDVFLSVEGKGSALSKVVKTIPEIKFGKLLRRVFSLIEKHADVGAARDSVREVLGAFSSEHSGILSEAKRSPQETGKIFPGVSVASFLLQMSTHMRECKEPEKTEFQADVMAAVLKMYALGKKAGALDEPSRISLLRLASLVGADGAEKALKAVGSGNSPGKALLEFAGEAQLDVLARPAFSLIQEKGTLLMNASPLKRFVRTADAPSLNKLKSVFQLTSAVDPLYCECQITTTRTEILLDILLVNQTDALLETVEFDFVSSPNIRILGAVTLDKLRPYMMRTLKVTLLMEEADSGYIGGTITAGRIGRDDYFLQNMQEIRFNLSDMLHRKSITREEFREKWPVLLWENLYTITLTDPLLTPSGVIEKIQGEIEGSEVESRAAYEEESGAQKKGILVRNIYAETAQGTEIYINATALAEKGKGLTATFRIRGEKCRVVKSLCQLISKKIKALAP